MKATPPILTKTTVDPVVVLTANSSYAQNTIHYTLDGSTPTNQSLEYEVTITLSETNTVKALCVKDGLTSSVTSRTYSKVDGNGGGEGGSGFNS